MEVKTTRLQIGINVCTLAIGKRYELQAEELAASLPCRLSIYDEQAVPNALKTPFNYNLKAVPVNREYCSNGVLFLDADTKCVNATKFAEFADCLRDAPPGVYSPFLYTCYGDCVSRNHDCEGPAPINESNYSRLSPKLKLLHQAGELQGIDLKHFYAPMEWMMFFKFRGDDQRNQFFRYWHRFEQVVSESGCTGYAQECYLIGLAALRSHLRVRHIRFEAGICHKNARIV